MSAMGERLPWQESEAELVQEFLRRFEADQKHRRADWKIYPETADWDLLIVHSSGFQLGIEAKLSLNAKVIDQALVGVHSRWARFDGPDYRMVLVPSVGRQLHLGRICSVIGIGIISLRAEEYGTRHGLNLPHPDISNDLPNWGPTDRCPVPDYIPDVTAGVKSPVKLTEWKVRAIKLSIVLDRKGWVNRSEMRALGISPSRWCDPHQGFLRQVVPGQYERCEATPDFRTQHPENYAQIEADVAVWGRELCPFKTEVPAFLFEPSPEAPTRA
jgi:hypothetical protein